MNYPLTSSGQVHAAAGLAEAVADRYGCVGVISRAVVGTAALLDQTERELFIRRIRCVRVQGPASGGLASRGLIAQIVGRPDPGALTDAELKAGFMALTEPGEGFSRVALLVAEAHSLLPSAVRYIQLARQATPAKLCVVLAGKPGLAAALAGDDFVPLRSAMHMMELPEPAGPGLFDRAPAMPEPPAPPRPRGSSPLARLGLAALIVPIVGLIWWRHLPAVPAAAVPPQGAPSVPAGIDAPSPSAMSPPAAPPPAAPAEPAGGPAPPEPGPTAPPQARASFPAEPDPAPSVTAAVPEPPASEASAKPEAPVESSADAAAGPPTAPEPPVPEQPAAEQPTAEPPAAVAAESPAIAADPPAATAAGPPGAQSERSEAPIQEPDLAERPAPNPAAPPDAVPPTPNPAIGARPPPHGTLTVTATPPAHGGARRAAVPVAVPQAAASPVRPAEDRPREDRAREDRAREDRPTLADERRCRDIVLKAQLGKDPSDADKQFLRSGCRSG